MKKIIYSLVIMIAAGSLFTSCIEQVEPVGIQNLRDAKAEYIRALKDLRAADAELQRAYAAVQQANARYRDAETAYKNAETELKNLQNEAQALANEKEAEKWAMELDSLKKQHEIDLVNLQKSLAEAQEALRAKLADIAALQFKLTTEEAAIVNAYVGAYQKLIAAQQKVRAAEEALWKAKYDSTSAERGLTAQDWKKVYENDKKMAEKDIELNTADSLMWAEAAEKYDYAKWSAEYQKYQDSVDYYKAQAALVAKEEAYYKVEICEAAQTVADSVKAWKDVYDAMPTGTTTDFKTEFKNGKKIIMPNQPYVNNLIATYLDKKPYNGESIVKGSLKVGVGAEKDTLILKAEDAAGAKKLINGDGTKDTIGLKGIVAALKRDLVLVKKFADDTVGINYSLDQVTKRYNDHLAALKAGVFADEKVVAAAAAADAAVTKNATDQATMLEKAKGLIDAIENFQSSYGATGSTQDSTLLFNAIKGFISARATFFGVNTKDADKIDSVKVREWVWDEVSHTYKQEEVYKAIADLDFDGFRQYVDGAYDDDCLDATGAVVVPNPSATFPISALYGGLKYSTKGSETITNDAAGQKKATKLAPDATAVDCDAFLKVVNRLTNTPMADWAAPKPTMTQLETKVWKDGAYKVYTYKEAAGDDPEGFYDGTTLYVEPAVAEAETKYDVAVANFYKDVYCAFWGLAYDPAEYNLGFTGTADSLTVTYTPDTFGKDFQALVFEGPQFVTSTKVDVEGAFSATGVVNNETIQIILDGIDPTFVYGAAPTTSYVIAGDAGLTEFAQMVLANQTLTYYTGVDEYLAALEEIEKDVEEFVKAVDTATSNVATKNAEAKKKNDAKAAYKKAKIGDKAWADIDTKDEVLACVDKGKWTLEGESKTLAEKLMADWPAKKLDWDNKTTWYTHIQTHFTSLSNALKTYVDAIYALDPDKAKYSGGTDPKEIYKKVQEYCAGEMRKAHNNVVAAEKALYTAEKNLAKLEAGFDGMDLAIAKAEDDLKIAQDELKQAENDYAIAKKGYDAIIAKYVG